MQIYPSLISSDLLNLQQTITTFDSLCAGYHIDVMDDHFVPNLTWGPAFVNAISKKTRQPLNVHLMVSNPMAWPKRLSLRPQDMITFHYESLKIPQEIFDCIKNIHTYGCKVGIALKPETSVRILPDIVPLVDSVLLMSVNPGFSGQKFMHLTTQKIEQLVTLRTVSKTTFQIGIDGGINESTINLIQPYPIDYVSIAAGIFATPDPVESFKKLKTLLSTQRKPL